MLGPETHCILINLQLETSFETLAIIRKCLIIRNIQKLHAFKQLSPIYHDIFKPTNCNSRVALLSSKTPPSQKPVFPKPRMTQQFNFRVRIQSNHLCKDHLVPSETRKQFQFIGQCNWISKESRLRNPWLPKSANLLFAAFPGTRTRGQGQRDISNGPFHAVVLCNFIMTILLPASRPGDENDREEFAADIASKDATTASPPSKRPPRPSTLKGTRPLLGIFARVYRGSINRRPPL